MKTTEAYDNAQRVDTGREAYSLIDLMIALCILTLIGAIAIPNIRRKLPERRLQGAVSAVVTQLRTARVRARSEARPVLVEVDSANTRLRFMSDRDGNSLYAGDEVSELDLTRFHNVELRSWVTNGVFTARGEFYCSTSALGLALRAGNAAQGFVYVFPGGLIEDSGQALF